MKVVKIKDIGKVTTGKTPSTKDLSLFGKDIPFITPSDISGFDARYVSKTERGISSKGKSKLKNLILPPNAICLVCIGSTIGKICLTSSESLTNQQLNSIIVNASYDYKYTYYLLRKTVPYIQQITGGTGAGKSILNKTSFENLEVNVITDKIEQKKIGNILGAYDDLIENNSKRIKILEEMAQKIYKEWFIDFKFPGYEKTKFKQTDLGLIPEDWNVDIVKNIVNNLIMNISTKSY